MPRKLTTEEFIKKAKKIYPQYDYSLVKYVNAQTSVKIICPNCGLKEIKATYILSGRGCSCEKHKYITNKIVKELNKKEIEDKYPNFEIDYSTFKGNFSDIKIKCKKCGNYFNRNVSNLKSKNFNCPWCSGRYKTTEQLKKQLADFYGEDFFDFSKIVKNGNNRTPLEIICKKCNKSFISNEHELLSKKNNGVRCPFCSSNMSKPEKRIKTFLDKKYVLNKTYFKEYTFDNFKSEKGGHFRYDFYIPSKNLLIEYNGEQHYLPKKKFGGIKQLKIQRHHDWLKRKYARNNGYKLLTIPYWNYKIIENILEENL